MQAWDACWMLVICQSASAPVWASEDRIAFTAVCPAQDIGGWMLQNSPQLLCVASPPSLCDSSVPWAKVAATSRRLSRAAYILRMPYLASPPSLCHAILWLMSLCCLVDARVAKSTHGMLQPGHDKDQVLQLRVTNTAACTARSVHSTPLTSATGQLHANERQQQRSTHGTPHDVLKGLRISTPATSSTKTA